VTRSECRHGEQLAGSCDVVGAGAAGEQAASLRRETPANVRGSSRRKQVFFLCDRRSYDWSIAGLGASRAPRYFASDFDRSNRLTGWWVRIEGVVIKEVSRANSEQYCKTRLVPQCGTGQGRGKSPAEVGIRSTN
jgi:hypothetical protein